MILVKPAHQILSVMGNSDKMNPLSTIVENNKMAKIVYEQHQVYETRQLIKNNKFESCIIKYSKHAKDIIFELVINDIPFHRISYGSGIIKLLKNDGNICEYCHGRGLLKIK